MRLAATIGRIAAAVAAGLLVTIAVAQEHAASHDHAEQGSPAKAVWAEMAVPQADIAVQQIDRGQSDRDRRADRATDTMTQLSHPDDRITAAPASGSVRADGRLTAATPIGGADRCDPAAPDGGAPTLCAHPIERRANQFQAPKATSLSPEQRLAIARQAGDLAAIAREADRLANLTSGKPLSATEQGVAALMLNEPPSSPPMEVEKNIDPAEVEALVQSIGTSTPVP